MDAVATQPKWIMKQLSARELGNHILPKATRKEWLWTIAWQIAYTRRNAARQARTISLFAHVGMTRLKTPQSEPSFRSSKARGAHSIHRRNMRSMLKVVQKVQASRAYADLHTSATRSSSSAVAGTKPHVDMIGLPVAFSRPRSGSSLQRSYNHQPSNEPR
jgi:hypothetical protein